ncbi:hypothetical protein ABW20_dc0104569 [Dactylellina cionopaga]|nr:hypothetical protein ABW20_dc0104569 [Dactylellina cionopaga]
MAGKAIANFMELELGEGQAQGLPTTSDDNTIDFTFHQVDQDGAGPYVCEVDPTSGGTDPKAFIPCDLPQNVPGVVGGLSTVTSTAFDCKAQFPSDMVCQGKSGGLDHVCVFKVKNNTPAGPFGGSGAFTQSEEHRARLGAAKRLRRSRFARRVEVGY